MRNIESRRELRLSKDAAEYEVADLRHIWEPPPIFNRLEEGNTFLIYGRKGSGKSTLVRYLSLAKNPSTATKHSDRKRSNDLRSEIVIIRPHEEDTFIDQLLDVMRNHNNDYEDNELEKKVIKIFEWMFMVKLMVELIPLADPLITPGTSQNKIYNFLVHNKIYKGSRLYKMIDLISIFLGKNNGQNTSNILNFASAPSKIYAETGFLEARDALFTYIRDHCLSVTVCLDDIDDIGFQYSRPDRILINSLIRSTIKSNKTFSDKKINIRVIITCPTELYYQSRVWGSDTIIGKCVCVKWSNPKAMQQLVNKRIALELEKKKRTPRFDGDVYSIETSQTWNRIFPSQIMNEFGNNELTFDYILRHSFYTPRHILQYCDEITDCNELEFEKWLERKDAGHQEASEIIRSRVVECSRKIVDSILGIWGRIFPGIDEVLTTFRDRPSIWYEQQLRSWIRNFCRGFMTRDDKRLSVEDVIQILYQIGFIGVGTLLPDADRSSYSSKDEYVLRFSFLEDVPRIEDSGWQIAVMSPLFFSRYNIQPIDHLVIVPHGKLIMKHDTLRKIRNYDFHNNSFPDSQT